MSRKIIWSTQERSAFVDMIEKEEQIEVSEQDVPEFLNAYKEFNQRYLEEVVKKGLSKTSDKLIIGFAVIYGDVHRNQMAVELGSNYKNIFNIPFESGTWYRDRWNIKADIEYKGRLYYYTFRTLKDETKQDIITRINQGKPMLTPTYLGHHTTTILRK